MATLRIKFRPLPAASFAGLAGFILLASCLGYGQAVNSCLDCHSAQPGRLEVTPEKFQPGYSRAKRLDLRQLPRRRRNQLRSRSGHEPQGGVERQGRPPADPAVVRQCHSNPAYIRQFDPSLRTDQLDQYHTSVHGKRLAAGDAKVAVCIDCHSVHDIRPPSDPRSTVNPVNVAKTCSRCHSDAAYMKQYGIPTDQFAKYNISVHHDAMVVRGDLSAPTCTTCHGNHGAAPPGVDKVQNVCANCHAFQAQMYEKSTHYKAFQAASLPGCVVCHSNHGIHLPSDAMLGTGPGGVCMKCHAPGDRCDRARVAILSNLTQLDGAIKDADQALHLAESSGMEVSEARLAQDQARDSAHQSARHHPYLPADPGGSGCFKPV